MQEVAVAKQTVAPMLIDILPRDIDAEIQRAKMGRMALDKLFRELLVQGVDFDRIPGTDKPTLLKPGAEILSQVFHLANGKPEMIAIHEDFVNGVFSYTIGIPIYHRDTGVLIAYGIGSANSKEPKYRYRYEEDEETKEKVRVDNPDPGGQQNTLVKMAAKRALVDGVLKATGASRMFSQDEDYMIPEKASSKQVNYIKMLFKGKPEDNILAEISQVLGREVTEWDLTREEASKVIEAKKGQAGDKKQTIPDTPKPARTKQETNGIDWQAFWTNAKNLGYDNDQVHAIACEIFNADVPSLKDVIPDQRSLNLFLQELAKRKKDAAKTA